jgi:hypothetical protein
MKCAVEMGSGVVIYVHTKFHKDRFRHSEVNRGDTQIHIQKGDLVSLFLFFQNKEWRLIKVRDVNLLVTQFICSKMKIFRIE